MLEITRWPDRLPMDVALLLENSGDTMQDVLDRHSLTQEQGEVFAQDPTFLKRVEDLRGEVREKGLTFRMKAKALAEEYLTVGYQMIYSPDVSAAVKADLIKSTTKWAGLEPKNDPLMTDTGGGGVSIQINLGAQTVQADGRMVDVSPKPVIEG